MRTVLASLKKLQEQSSFQESELRQLVRFALVYVLLFLLMICSSSGAFGKTLSAKISLENLNNDTALANEKQLGSFALEASHFQGNYVQTAADIQALLDARKNHVEQLRLQEAAERARLREEHKSLMLSFGNQGYDEADKTNTEFTKWNTAIYNNIGQQSLLKQVTDDKVAAWDTANYVKVQYQEKDGKKYIVKAQVIRAKSAPATSAVATSK